MIGGDHLTSLAFTMKSTKEVEKYTIIQFFVCLLGYLLIILGFILAEKKERERERQREITNFTVVRLCSLLKYEIKILSDINSGNQEKAGLIEKEVLNLYKIRRDFK